MGNSPLKVGEGLYICGVEDLRDISALKGLGITHIVNAAGEEFYDGSLVNLRKSFEVLVLDLADEATANISVWFEAAANFIHLGRKTGGVVVHCHAGVSRSSTVTIAYLMLKENLSLAAAFQKVHKARPMVRPNPGFWRQLRDLEAVLIAQGHRLVPLDWEAQSVLDRELQASCRRQAEGLDVAPDHERCLSMPWWMMKGCTRGGAQWVSPEAYDFGLVYVRLHLASIDATSFATKWMEAVLPLDEEDIQGQIFELQQAYIPGVRAKYVKLLDDAIYVKARVVPFMDEKALHCLLSSVGKLPDEKFVPAYAMSWTDSTADASQRSF